MFNFYKLNYILTPYLIPKYPIFGTKMMGDAPPVEAAKARNVEMERELAEQLDEQYRIQGEELAALKKRNERKRKAISQLADSSEGKKSKTRGKPQTRDWNVTRGITCRARDTERDGKNLRATCMQRHASDTQSMAEGIGGCPLDAMCGCNHNHPRMRKNWQSQFGIGRACLCSRKTAGHSSRRQ